MPKKGKEFRIIKKARFFPKKGKMPKKGKEFRIVKKARFFPKRKKGETKRLRIFFF